MCTTNRKTPVLVLTILSAIVIVLGLTITGLAVRFVTISSILDAETDGRQTNREFEQVKARSIAGLFLSGGLTLIAGIMGLLFNCCKNRFYAMFYGSLIGLIWITVFILGCIIGSVSNASP